MVRPPKKRRVNREKYVNLYSRGRPQTPALSGAGPADLYDRADTKSHRLLHQERFEERKEAIIWQTPSERKPEPGKRRCITGKTGSIGRSKRPSTRRKRQMPGWMRTGRKCESASMHRQQSIS